MTEPLLASRDADPPSASVAARAQEFESFVRDRSTALLRTAYLLTGDPHLAEDLVQSALARTHGAWKRLHETGNAEAYTRKVMYHLQVSWWRKRRVAESLSEVVPDQFVADDTNSLTALRLTLHQALLRLTAKQRAVIVLRFFEDRTVSETADILNCAIGTVKSQTAKGLARLRTIAPDLNVLYTEEGELR
ncbi:SigE family RNA polymerase sigma factor [Stackebrandtia nassauensis]|uniref:RNA polymerase, sigma-24 subunit, ECF subfamily n=1 Tax=Stackebrandtia nassauensis (strain DSM 44728 / CIP 108903 / NRRL B-16338 / NBRC 102104 / LLR-40K-21) TaxID=446470 RepID=D3Q3B9_STANL|nr:SigE family RNA polymerase sigma factor [Stackebrandtia nassauensis]ADD41960.1 RNA polymerase, sigma-24 subunit, ECF subfamily [Stackebrandtia nassauensis DSM 44728]